MNTSIILADMAMTTGGLGQGLVLLVVAIIVLSFLWWLNQTYVPEPMRKWVVLVIVLFCVLILCNFVLSMGGGGFIKW